MRFFVVALVILHCSVAARAVDSVALWKLGDEKFEEDAALIRSGGIYYANGDSQEQQLSAEEALEYLRRSVHEKLDPYWNPEASLLNLHERNSDSLDISSGTSISGISGSGGGQVWFLVEWRPSLRHQYPDAVLDALLRLYMTDMDRPIREDTVIVCNGNLALLYANVSSERKEGNDQLQSMDRRMLQTFRDMSRDSLEGLRNLERNRLERFRSLTHWIDDGLVPNYSLMMQKLDDFSYSRYGDEDQFGQWKEYAQNVGKTIRMLEELKDRLEKENVKWAMPHQISQLIAEGEWERVIDLSTHTTGGRYGGIRVLSEMYSLSASTDFETPSLKIMAQFLSQIDSGELPTADSIEIARVIAALHDEKTTRVDDIRIYRDLAVAERHYRGEGSRVYLRREQGLWRIKGLIYGWIS